MMSFLWDGVLVGLSIAAPVGAIGFLCIQTTLYSGITRGVVSGLGAATADSFYGVLVALGLTASQAFLLQYRVPLTIAGGLFLCYLGIKKILSAPPTATKHAQVAKSGLFSAYIVTFFLTLTNPTTILDFMALFTSLNINAATYGDALSFVGGVFLGSAAWWLILCFSVGFLRHKISDHLLRYINYVAGTVIFGFGLLALIKLWRCV